MPADRQDQTTEAMPNELLIWLNKERAKARAEGWKQAVSWLQNRAKFDAGPWLQMSAPDALQDAAREMESIDV